MLRDREGKVDVPTGCSVDGGTIVAHKYPRVASLQESVGAYLIATPQLIAIGNIMQSTASLTEAAVWLPGSEARRKLGAATMNLSVAILSSVAAIEKGPAVLDAVQRAVFPPQFG